MPTAASSVTKAATESLIIAKTWLVVLMVRGEGQQATTGELKGGKRALPRRRMASGAIPYECSAYVRIRIWKKDSIRFTLSHITQNLGYYLAGSRNLHGSITYD